MAVKSKKEGQKLILEIDNGDLIKLDEVIQRWNFKDYQSFFRFSVSLLILSEDKSISIKLEGNNQEIIPAAHLLSNSPPMPLLIEQEKLSPIEKKG